MPARRQSGFTLLEVVVAFVVLALTLSTVFEVFSTGLARAGDLEEHSKALAIAQSKLSGAGVEEPIKEGELRGATRDRHYRWLVKTARHQEPPAPGAGAAGTAPAPSPQSTYSLYRIDVVVEWTTATGAVRNVQLATLELGPRIATP